MFGTFWIQSPNDYLNFVSSFNDQVAETNKTRTTSFAQMLSANLGKRVRLHIGKDEILDGKVVEMEKIEKPKERQSHVH